MDAKRVVDHLLAEALDDNLFENPQTKLSFSLTGDDGSWMTYEPQHTRTTYDIELEGRSWGYKSITVTLRGVDPITVVLKDAEDRETDVTYQIDPRQLRGEAQGRGVICVTEIYLVGDPKGAVDYQKSYYEYSAAF